MAKVASTPGAIGYVSLDVLDDTVKTLAIDEVEPTVENIKGGSYVIYWFDGPGKVTNNGDGGFLNWGVLGNNVKTDNVISINGG